MSDLFDGKFIKAFNHAMLFEVGSFWNPTDPEVIAGLCATADQKKKTGYNITPGDTGGETKFGIAKNSNQDLNIVSIDLETAMQRYYDVYWQPNGCVLLPDAVAIMHFDGCINHGPKRANIFLQRACGAAEDGKIGPATLATVISMDQQTVISNLRQTREDFYNEIVNKKESQRKFLKGWLRRVNSVAEYCTSIL